jgi:hypothetical protein
MNRIKTTYSCLEIILLHYDFTLRKMKTKYMYKNKTIQETVLFKKLANK